MGNNKHNKSSSTSKHNKTKNDILLEMQVRSKIKKELEQTKSQASRFAIVCMEILSITILNDKFGFTIDQLREYLKYLMDNANILTGDYATIRDYYNALKEEGTITPDIDLILKTDPDIAEYFELDESEKM